MDAPNWTTLSVCERMVKLIEANPSLSRFGSTQPDRGHRVFGSEFQRFSTPTRMSGNVIVVDAIWRREFIEAISTQHSYLAPGETETDLNGLIEPSHIIYLNDATNFDGAVLNHELSRRLFANKWSGIIVQGSVQGCQQLSGSQLPVWAMSRTPMPWRPRPILELDHKDAQPLTPCLARTGDYVFADADGLVIIDRPTLESDPLLSAWLKPFRLCNWFEVAKASCLQRKAMKRN